MSRSFVTDAVVATLERLGRGSCADIERWGGIAEGGSRAALWDLHAKGVARICAWERFHEKSAPRGIWALGSSCAQQFFLRSFVAIVSKCSIS